MLLYPAVFFLYLCFSHALCTYCIPGYGPLSDVPASRDTGSELAYEIASDNSQSQFVIVTMDDDVYIAEPNSLSGTYDLTIKVCRLHPLTVCAYILSFSIFFICCPELALLFNFLVLYLICEYIVLLIMLCHVISAKFCYMNSVILLNTNGICVTSAISLELIPIGSAVMTVTSASPQNNRIIYTISSGDPYNEFTCTLVLVRKLCNTRVNSRQLLAVLLFHPILNAPHYAPAMCYQSPIRLHMVDT